MSHSLTAAVTNRITTASSRHPYAATTLMIAAVTAFGLVVGGTLHPANLDALFLLVVFVTALEWGRRPAIFAALTSTVVFDFCFIPPRFSFAITDLAYLVTLSVFVVVAIITSELAARARDLMRAQTARAKAEALAQAKDALLNRIAHELRSPLTTILGWVQMLRADATDTQRTGRGLAGLERNAQLLARLVGDLLDVSRVHVGKLRVRLQPLALAPIVSRALEDAAILASEKRVLLECSVDPVDTVLADEHRIEQIVANLVSNALKFTPSNGRVAVRLAQDGQVVRLTVADTGAGIAADFIAHVFEPFAQADGPEHQHGLGLGLAIVKHLVEAHHGRISVHSDGPGRGSTFVAEFPVTEMVADAAVATLMPEARVDSHGSVH